MKQPIDIRSLLTIAVGGKRRTERHVRTYAQPGKQRALLEDDAAVRPRPNDRLAVQQNLALRWRLKASKKIEQRRFSASARADDRDELTVCNVEFVRPEEPSLRRPSCDTPSARFISKFNHSPSESNSSQVPRGFGCIR